MASEKITLTIASTTGPGGPLYQMVDNLRNQNSEVEMTQEGTNLIIDYSNVVKSENRLNADEAIILDILANDGDIENYLFGIRQPSASAGLKVPEDVPMREFILYNLNPVPANLKNFGQWFGGNASVWLNNVTSEIIYYNQPNPSNSIILTASESKLIKDIDEVNYTFLTVAEVQTIVLDPNWVKL